MKFAGLMGQFLMDRSAKLARLQDADITPSEQKKQRHKTSAIAKTQSAECAFLPRLPIKLSGSI